MKGRILRKELLALLKQARQDKKLGNELLTVMEKIKKEEQLESNEFLKVYEILWKEGPKVKYSAPENWARPGAS